MVKENLLGLYTYRLKTLPLKTFSVNPLGPTVVVVSSLHMQSLVDEIPSSLLTADIFITALAV